MADMMNPFDLLGDDVEDPSSFISAQEKLEVPKKKDQSLTQPKPQHGRLPSKPAPPSQAVREARNEGNRGSGRGGRGRGRGPSGGSYNRESAGYDNGTNNGFSGGMKTAKEGETGEPFERRGYGAPRGNYHGGRRNNYNNGDAGEGERPRRAFERRSGTGHGNDFKRDGAGRGNWGTPSDDVALEAEGVVNETENSIVAAKQSREEDAVEVIKENPEKESEEKEPEDKEMTLEEYEKVLEEKRKGLSALKTEVRKVDVDRELQSMQQLSKKANNDIFIKLGSDKEKRKDAADKEEKVKKSVSINEFLKPAEGERHYGPGGRGRGRGRGSRGGNGGHRSNIPAPPIEDPRQFPSLSAK